DGASRYPFPTLTGVGVLGHPDTVPIDHGRMTENGRRGWQRDIGRPDWYERVIRDDTVRDDGCEHALLDLDRLDVVASLVADDPDLALRLPRRQLRADIAQQWVN